MPEKKNWFWYIPLADDVVQQLVWGSDGRSVRDVWVAGQQVAAVEHHGDGLGLDGHGLAPAELLEGALDVFR